MKHILSETKSRHFHKLSWWGNSKPKNFHFFTKIILILVSAWGLIVMYLLPGHTSNG